MAGVAAAIGGAAILGYIGSQQAAETQANAQNRAIGAQQDMFQQQMRNEAPYLQAGVNALGQIQQNLPNWNAAPTAAQILAQDPGYQFRLQQGQQAIQQSAAASGSGVGASQLAALGNYTQNAASSEYQNAFNRYQQQIQNSYNRLASVAGLGQTGVQTVASGAQNAANNIGAAQVGIGQAQAAGQLGQINALTGAAGQYINYQQGLGLQQSIQGLGGGTTQLNAPNGSPYAVNAGNSAIIPSQIGGSAMQVNSQGQMIPVSQLGN